MDKFNVIEITNFCNQKCLLKSEKKATKTEKLPITQVTGKRLLNILLFLKNPRKRQMQNRKMGKGQKSTSQKGNSNGYNPMTTC